MIKEFKKASLVVLLLLTSVVMQAQRINNTLYMMKDLPQSSYVNPAIQPSEYKYFIGVPLISSIYTNYSNSGFSYRDLVKEGIGVRKDSLVLDVNSFHDALSTTNFGSIETEVALLAFGVKFKDYYFTFDVFNKTDVRGNFNKEVITFLKDGNADYKGKTSDWGKSNIDAFVYNEIALGASKKLNEKWTVGAKAKVLMGLANARLEDSNIAVTTSASGDMVTLHSKQRLKTSLPISQINTRDDGTVKNIRFNKDDYGSSFFTNTSNLGFAIDLGMTYQANYRTRIYASVLDLGAITWKSDVNEFTQDANFKWRGDDWSQSGNPNAPNYKEIKSVFKNIVDSLKQDINIDSTKGQTYTTVLPTKIYLGGSYSVNEKIDLGALFRTTIYNGKALPSITFSGNAKLLKWLSTSLSYSIANNSYTNVGLGVAAKMGAAQFYFVSDNIIAGIDPNNARLANFRFGVNILLGRRRERAESNSCTINDAQNYRMKKHKKKRRRR